MTPQETRERIRERARDRGWAEIDHQENIMMISFTRKLLPVKTAEDISSIPENSARVNVYYGKPWRLTVATIINHPKVGRRQLFRKHITIHELDNILINPRIHTGKGYYTTK